MAKGLPVRPVSTRVMNLGDLLTQTARRLGGRPGLIWGERRWTWAELDARVDAVARGLAAHGVAKGDRVLVQSRNNNAMFESLFACFKLGAVWTPVNFRLTPDDVGWIAGAAGVRAVVYDAPFRAHADAVARAADLAATIAITEPRAGELAWEELAAGDGGPFRAIAVDRDDACWFFFTSGTTGRPKAAVLTHGQLAFVVNNHLADLMPGLGEADASLVVAPLSHGAGMHQLVQVARGVPSILLEGERFDPDEVFRLIERHRVANMFTVPTIVKRLVEDPAVDRYDRASLRHVVYAGAPMYRADQQVALEKLGKVIVQYFGLGEVTGNITVLPPHLHDVDDARQGRIGSCGYPRTGIDITIQDDDGRILKANETGEICVTGAAVFAGYFDNPEANAKAFRNGWFRTGDLGHLDHEGFLYITGRASDMYISGGSNVYPREIEERLLQHPAIREVAVVGVPDPDWGEAGVAAVVAAPGAHVEPAALLAWLADKLARYKRPREVHLFDELPKSAYGKITKSLVRPAIDDRRRGEAVAWASRPPAACATRDPRSRSASPRAWHRRRRRCGCPSVRPIRWSGRWWHRSPLWACATPSSPS